MSKTINLVGKCGGTTLVDDEWYEELNQYKWHKSSSGYAIRRAKINNSWATIRMHRVINNTPEGFETDHINRNKLNNRACNLRTVTRSENMLNCWLRSDNTSGYIGICWDKSRNKYLVTHKGKFVCRRSLLKDAVKARKEYMERS